MNRDMSSPQHPDAELLNAFAEDALTPEERLEMVEHLEACAECRQVIFLVADISLQEVALPSFRVSNSADSRGKRVSAWRVPIWLCGGIAAAALVIVTVVLFHKLQSQPVQTAVIQQQPAEAILQPKGGKAAIPSAPIAKKEHKEQHAAGVGTTKAATSNPLVSELEPKSAEVSENNSAVQGEQTLLSQDEGGSKDSNRLRAFAPSGASPLHKGQQKLELLGRVSSAAEEVRRVSDVSRAERVPSTPLRVKVSSGSSVALPRPQSEAVLFLNESALKQDKVSPSEILHVPSNKTVVSSATRRKDVVAIDSDGTVFFSSDTGLHWQQIPMQWRGKAGSVQVLQSFQYPPAPSASPASLTTLPAEGLFFELKNDSFESWRSSDGRIWVPKK